MADGYYPLHLAAPLMPGEWRDLRDGRVRICCKDCGDAYEAASLEAGLAGHWCIRRPVRSDPVG